MKNELKDGKMRAILTRLMNMSDTEFENFKPQNQKESAGYALAGKAKSGDIKALEFVMRITGDMPTKDMESETDEEIDRRQRYADYPGLC